MATHLRKQGLPVAAWAFVPDPEQPETWKFRLWETGQGLCVDRVTQAARELNESGLLRARGATGKAAKRARAKIRSAYQRLEVPVESMPAWIRESDEEPIEDFFAVTLSEASGDGATAVVRFIAPGFNKSKSKYYPAETLARAASLFEGAKMFIDHATDDEERRRPEGSVLNMAGILRNVRVAEDGSLEGTAHIVQAGLRQTLANLREAGALDAIGLSIRALGKVRSAIMEGVKTLVVESIQAVRSVDWVTEAGAGGRVLLIESDRIAIEDLTDEILQTERPDLVESLQRRKHDMDTLEALTAEVKTLKESLGKQVEDTQAMLDAALKERDDALAKVTESETAAKKASAQAEILKAVQESDLPEPARKRVVESLKEATDASGVAAAIDGEKKYLASLKESGKVTDFGRGKSTDDVKPEDARKELKESFKRSYLSSGCSEAEAERMAEIAAVGR